VTGVQDKTMDGQGYERGDERRDVDEGVLVDRRVTTIRSLVTCITIHYHVNCINISQSIVQTATLITSNEEVMFFCIYLWACLVYNSTDKVVKILGAVFARGNLKTITDVVKR